MDPLTAALMSSSNQEQDTILASSTIWQVARDSSVTLSNSSFTSSGTSQGRTVTTNALPALTATGWYIDVNLIGGHPNKVGWLGIANTQSIITFSNSSSYTGWYWSGSVYTPTDQYSIGATLVEGTYRIAVALGASPHIFFRGPDGVVRGPHLLPQTTSLPGVYLMVMGQSGFEMPSAQLVNGNVYEGGGGLFLP